VPVEGAAKLVKYLRYLYNVALERLGRPSQPVCVLESPPLLAVRAGKPVGPSQGWLRNLLDVVFACARLRRMDSEIASAALQRLLGINKNVLGGLAAKGIGVWGNKRGSYRIETITRYCEHLREMASARGGERAEDARARLG
jgi:hypothetical protein